MQANDPAWHRLRPNHTLRLALAQKEVVEFPVITVVLPQELPAYNLLGSREAVQQTDKEMALQSPMPVQAQPAAL